MKKKRLNHLKKQLTHKVKSNNQIYNEMNNVIIELNPVQSVVLCNLFNGYEYSELSKITKDCIKSFKNQIPGELLEITYKNQIPSNNENIKFVNFCSNEAYLLLTGEKPKKITFFFLPYQALTLFSLFADWDYLNVKIDPAISTCIIDFREQVNEKVTEEQKADAMAELSVNLLIGKIGK